MKVLAFSLLFAAFTTAAIAAVLVSVVASAVGDSGFAMGQIGAALIKAAPAGVISGIFFGAALWRKSNRATSP
ncbi:hypothetical protein [Lysobacter sp.]|uniref:hypothetical protein n=1 Tax=Lysobacter sp. TaxID=72226 RepID=UPI002D3687BC|nr:hypothetical protein [Lysobacter sp.]HZX77312.1 hypothetical protein [Lysobacter sp.]